MRSGAEGTAWTISTWFLIRALSLPKRIYALHIGVLAVSKAPNNQGVGQLLVPAVNNMFDITKAGIAMIVIHPPIVIYLLLMGLAVLGGFLVGYTSSERKMGHCHSIHVLSYVVLVAFVIYLIIDLELPRVGLIRVNAFDHILVDVQKEWMAS